MEFTISAEMIVSLSIALGGALGWYSRSIERIVNIDSKAKAAHKRLDRLEEFLGVGSGRVFEDSKTKEEKEK